MEQLHLFPRDGPPCRPLVVAYGMGVDSTAVLVGLRERNTLPDLILFADVGGEKPATVAYLPIINHWLEGVGFPRVRVVRYVVGDFKNWPPYASLEENCLTNGTLPSMAFGYGSCSLKWKAAPQDRFLKEWPPAALAWRSGGRVCKAIGYDCSPRDQVRRTYADKASRQDRRYDYWYPLHDWGWTRDDCEAAIRRTGLPVPPKSACFFCPASKPGEIDQLPAEYLKRIVIMEARARPRLTKVEGLWRTSTKSRPGSMTQYIRTRGLLPADEIDRLTRAVPTEIMRRNEAHAAGRPVESWTQFFNRILAPSANASITPVADLPSAGTPDGPASTPVSSRPDGPQDALPSRRPRARPGTRAG